MLAFWRGPAMSPELAFGQVLMQTRRDNKLSQDDLAFASDLDRTFISRLENGHRQPSLTTILQLARTLGVPAARMIDNVEQVLDG